MQRTLQMYNIPLLGGPGFIFKLTSSWANGKIGGDSASAIFAATQDGKYVQVSGVLRDLPEVEDAIEHFLRGSEAYGNPDKYGVHARVLNRRDWTELHIPDLGHGYYLAKITHTYGEGNPNHWFKCVEPVLPQLFTQFVKEESRGYKLNIIVDDTKVVNLKQARALLRSNPDGHKKLTIKFDRYWDYHKRLQKPIYDKVTIEIDLR